MEFAANLKILRKLMKFVWPKDDRSIKMRVLLAFGLLIAGKGITVCVPIIYKQIVDICGTGQPEALTMLALLSATYGLSRLLASGFQELRNAVFASVSQRTMRTTARKVYSHLLNLDAEFHANSSTGGLVRSIDRGTKGINQVLSAMVFHILPTTFEITTVCGLLYYSYGLPYALVTLSTVVIYSFFTILTTRWRVKFRKQMNLADNQAGSKATDSLLNIDQIQLSNSQSFSTDRYDKALQAFENAAVRSIHSLSLLNGGQNAIFSIALGIQMYMASKGVAMGTMTVGDVVMINGLLFQISFPLHFLGSVYRDTRQSLVDMNSLFSKLEIKSLILESKSYPPFVARKGEIQFKNIKFEYSDGRKVLNGINAVIPAGKTVAFVGPSGCGKSTLLKLLTRLYDPTDGSVVIDDQDVSKVELTSLRDQIGVVPQDTILFNATIYDNIRYGNTTVTPEGVFDAAKKAEIYDLIHERFPEKFDTLVGERGVMVSGGEKQRIQISRLFVKNPPIALFDEPTSALDQQTEVLLMNTIKKWIREGGREKTAVFIAHRLSTVRDCDIIFVLDHGVIVESGNHDELIAKAGIYSQMWTAQTH